MLSESGHYHPFQKLCSVELLEKDLIAEALRERYPVQLLCAASGPYIFVLDPGSRKILSRWPPADDDKESAESNGKPADGRLNDGRPAKRLKTDSNGQGNTSSESEDSIEIVAQRKKGERRKPKLASQKLPNVSHLIAVPDHDHLVSVTGEDKCLRVFKLGQDGKPDLLSERSMPKRVCAIVAHGEKIIVGDKFGDVYELPLFETQTETSDQEKAPIIEELPAFKPAASEFTVHTKGNREALRQQQALKASKPKKEGPSFEHKLILGHVSLLTDLTLAHESVLANGTTQQRTYVLTSDRDEHIRVSRGPPQSHIIENYCLGHKEFVTELCIPPWSPMHLISGSGEPSLKVFTWKTGELIQDLLAKESVMEAFRGCLARHAKAGAKLGVLGIWPAPVRRNIVVAIEGIPFLLIFNDISANEMTFQMAHCQTIDLPGNPIDVVFLDSQMVVSMDLVHAAGSVKEHRSSPAEPSASLQAFDLRDNEGWVSSDLLDPIKGGLESSRDLLPRVDTSAPVKEKATYSVLGEFLYGLENLRKNRSSDNAVANEEDGDEGLEADIEPEG